MEEEIEISVFSEEGVPTPVYASQGAAGADISAKLDKPLVIAPRQSALIPTGLFFEIPPGFEVQVRPRSGLALRDQITVLNSPGTIDCDYRGEIKVILINHGSKDFIVEPGMRIAQIVVAPIVQARFVRRDKLSLSARGAGGFGHTGVR